MESRERGRRDVWENSGGKTTTNNNNNCDYETKQLCVCVLLDVSDCCRRRVVSCRRLTGHQDVDVTATKYRESLTHSLRQTLQLDEIISRLGWLEDHLFSACPARGFSQRVELAYKEGSMEMGAVSDTHTHAGEGVQQPPRRTATTTISRALSPWEKKTPQWKYIFQCSS